MPENAASLAQVPIPTDPQVDLRSLTPNQLAELGGNPEMLDAARAEVFRRLEDGPRKANFLTFRWFLPADEADKADAFDGLMKTCWNAVEARHAVMTGSFVDSQGNTTDFPNFEKTRDAIVTELIDCLYNLRSLSVSDIILQSLTYQFHPDVDAANAIRRKKRQERKNPTRSFAPNDEEEEAEFQSLLHAVPENASITARPNPYSTLVEFIEEHETEILDVVGEEGWQVLVTFVDLADTDNLPATKRDRERVLTQAISARCGVKERQARTKKRRLQQALDAAAAGNPIITNLKSFADWGCRERNGGGNSVCGHQNQDRDEDDQQPEG